MPANTAAAAAANGLSVADWRWEAANALILQTFTRFHQLCMLNRKALLQHRGRQGPGERFGRALGAG